jgi:hypothetical protein
MRLLLATLVLLSPLAAHASATLTVIPADPAQNEPVFVRVQSDGTPLNRASFVFENSMVVSLPNNHLRLLAAGPTNIPNEGGPVDYTFYVGRLPVGNYSIDLAYSESTSVTPMLSATFQVQLPDAALGANHALNPADYSGLWYAPSESGTAVMFEQSPLTRKLGGVLYFYEAPNRPVWYLLVPAAWTNASLTQNRLEIRRTTGTPFDRPYSAADSSSVAVGEMIVNFTAPKAMTVTYTIGTLTRTVEMQKFTF